MLLFYKYKEEKIKRIIILIIVFILININFVYAKFIEKIKQTYITQIAKPILVVESDEKTIINDLENIDSKMYNFKIKNYDDIFVNTIQLYYQLEVVGVSENISYELWDTSQHERITLVDGKSEYFKLGFKKKEVNYRLIIDFFNSEINENSNINIKINTRLKNEEE